MDAFAHRMRYLRARGIEGIVYVEPYYCSIVFAPVSVESMVDGGPYPCRCSQPSWQRVGSNQLSEIGSGGDYSAIPAGWLTLSNLPSTTVNDIKTTDADAVSPVSVPVYVSNDSWTSYAFYEGVSGVDSLRFTMDGFALRWMDPRLIVDSSATDGPQQANFTPRRTSLTLASLCQARTPQGTEEVRKTRRPRNSADKGGHCWRWREWFHPCHPHLKSSPILPSRRCTKAEEEQEDYCPHKTSPFDHSWNCLDFVGRKVQGEAGGLPEAVGERFAVGHRTFQD